MTEKENTWHGVDSSKEESLFVYGCLARYMPKTKFYEVVYRHPYIQGNWESCFTTEETINDFLQEDWLDKEGFLSYVGMMESEWLDLLFIQKVHDLVSWKCVTNFFGEPYNEGFTTKVVCKKVRIAYDKEYEPN